MSFDNIPCFPNSANGMIIGKLMQKDLLTVFIKCITIMKQLKLRFEIAIWNCFLTSVIVIWPILMLFDTGWLSTFKDNISTSVEQFMEELEKDL